MMFRHKSIVAVFCKLCYYGVMKNEYEENFRRDLHKKMESESLQKKINQKQGVAWAIVVVLAVMILFETIVLSIVLVNASDSNDSYDFETTEDDIVVEDFDVDLGEEYDEEGNVVAIEQKCTSDGGEKFEFKYDKKYKRYGKDGDLVDEGSYDMVNGSLLALKDGTEAGRVLYYDGYSVADGLTLYYCDGGV